MLVDLGVEHRFKVGKFQPWIGVLANNAFDTFLPSDVQNNLGSPRLRGPVQLAVPAIPAPDSIRALKYDSHWARDGHGRGRGAVSAGANAADWPGPIVNPSSARLRPIRRTCGWPPTTGRTAIAAGEFDRRLKFLEKLVDRKGSGPNVK